MNADFIQTVSDAARVIEATPVVGNGAERLVTGVYCSDLLSDVLAHAEEGNLWITVQNHRNIVAVAETRDLAAIIVAGGRPILEEARQHAERLDVIVYSSPLSVYEIAGRLYQTGLGRSHHSSEVEGANQ